MFVQTIEDEDISAPPPVKKLKKSQCTPLFMCAYRMRGTCKLVIISFSCFLPITQQSALEAFIYRLIGTRQKLNLFFNSFGFPSVLELQNN